MTTAKKNLRWLPSIEKFTQQLTEFSPFDREPVAHLTALVRESVDQLRAQMLSDAAPDFASEAELHDHLRNELYWALAGRLDRVVNGTGIVIHTNLGRSLLADVAKDAVQTVATHYNTLEYDVRAGGRGSRHSQIAKVLRRLLNVEAAMVVNNNAAATFLVLNTLAQGKEVIISRGQLVEIGGSYRMPDVMKQSQAIMVEVGATNKTKLADYEEAITDNTGLLVEVHTSNYRIEGFTQSVPLADLADLGHRHDLPVYSDLGSGVLIDLSQYGIEKEPTVQDSLKAGADVVSFSGDKLLGGPQAGIIIGKNEYIDRMLKNPFTRMMRCDKFTLAALEATLGLYYDKEQAVQNIPTLNRITKSPEELKQLAQRLQRYLQRNVSDAIAFGTRADESEIGGGSLPTVKLPTTLVTITPENLTVSQLEAALRRQPVPIISRVQHDQVLLDPRTLLDADKVIIADALNRIASDA